VTELLDAPTTLDADPGTREARRSAARATLGVTGHQESEPLRPVLKRHNLTVYTMTALGLLGVVDVFQAQAFTILTPEISRALGLGLGAIAGARTLAFMATILAPLPVAALAQKRGRLALICIVTGVAWSVITLTTGFVTSLLALLAVLVFDGLSTGSVAALHAPFLTSAYPPTARVRVLSIYQGLVTLGQVLSPLFVSLLTGPLDLTWRGVFVIMGVTSLAASFYALGLRDPEPGQFDTELLREEEHERVTGEREDFNEDDVALGFFEIVRRLLLIPTVQRISVGFFVFGILVIPFQTFLSAFLAQRWGLSPSERGLFFSGTAAIGIVALVVYGRRAEKEFAKDPAQVLGTVGLALGAAVACIALGGVMPLFPLTCLFFAAGMALIAVLVPGLNVSIMSIIDARYRPHAAALTGIFAASGSLLGILLLSSVNDSYGTTGSMVALAFPGVGAGLIIRSARKFINADLDRMIDEVLETEDVRVIRERGGKLPMLQAKGIDFSYGQLQVLFDVDFTVDDGEMVALLGTNGAGKSTLLKVISGIGLPSTGTVRYRGEDITYLDAERRVPLGITQVPGGRAVFGTMDVVENLRTFAYTLGRDKKRVDELIDTCFEAFPRLYERRTSLAATMSGGEQQMLGLSKALILQPKLLLIDELSLGLAPKVVGELLEAVRAISRTGTAVVLVEQSVNVAVSIAERAYFMEKGRILFDGPAAGLMDRTDLLRAVFLRDADPAAHTHALQP
jgi:ABC-type branched-subunit amino acid transport system ATPase component/sugar phosphate permease